MTGICLNIQPPPPRGSSGSTDAYFDSPALDSLRVSVVTDMRNPIPAPQSWLIPIRSASRTAVMMNEIAVFAETGAEAVILDEQGEVR